jgi:hypothetical protein
MEAVEDADVPEWLQILKDEASVLLAEEYQETGFLHKCISDRDGIVCFHAN